MRSTDLCVVVGLVYARVGVSVMCVGSVGMHSCMYKIVQLYPDERLEKTNGLPLPPYVLKLKVNCPVIYLETFIHSMGFVTAQG